jgi:hypothetical protein
MRDYNKKELTSYTAILHNINIEGFSRNKPILRQQVHFENMECGCCNRLGIGVNFVWKVLYRIDIYCSHPDHWPKTSHPPTQETAVLLLSCLRCMAFKGLNEEGRPKLLNSSEQL